MRDHLVTFRRQLAVTAALGATVVALHAAASSEARPVPDPDTTPVSSPIPAPPEGGEATTNGRSFDAPTGLRLVQRGTDPNEVLTTTAIPHSR